MSSPLLPVNRLMVPDGVPQWQADEDVDTCPLCDTNFSLFFRRHHCRKCGRVVCGNCSAIKTTYLPSTYVVCPPSQIFLETPHIPHRTCDECAEELDMIRNALRARGAPRRSSRSTDSQLLRNRSPADGTRTNISDNEYNINHTNTHNHIHRIEGPSTSSGVHGGYRRVTSHNNNSHIKHSFEPIIESLPINSDYEETSSDLDESSTCPICSTKFASHIQQHDRESHIDNCLKDAEFSGSPDKQHRANRMIVYRLSEKEAMGLDECVICFEEFKQGDSVGRLECLCVYHERCILDWFARKGAGECPVHAVHT